MNNAMSAKIVATLSASTPAVQYKVFNCRIESVRKGDLVVYPNKDDTFDFYEVDGVYVDDPGATTLEYVGGGLRQAQDNIRVTVARRRYGSR